jgi:hypothetical protein
VNRYVVITRNSVYILERKIGTTSYKCVGRTSWYSPDVDVHSEFKADILEEPTPGEPLYFMWQGHRGASSTILSITQVM